MANVAVAIYRLRPIQSINQFIRLLTLSFLMYKLQKEEKFVKKIQHRSNAMHCRLLCAIRR